METSGGLYFCLILYFSLFFHRETDRQTHTNKQCLIVNINLWSAFILYHIKFLSTLFSLLIILLGVSNFQKMSSDDHTLGRKWTWWETWANNYRTMQTAVRWSSQAPVNAVYLPTMDEHLLFEGEGIALFWHPTSKLSPCLKRVQFKASTEGGSVHKRPLKRWKGKGFIILYFIPYF